MKKRGKVYLGILFSFIMVLMVSISSMAAEDNADTQPDDEIVLTDDEDDTDQSGGSAESGELDNDDGQEDSEDEENSEPEPEPVAVQSIQLNQSSLTLNVKGQTSKLSVTFTPDDATNPNVTWKSSNTAIATVDNSGTVTASGNNGTATITVTSEDGGKTATCAVTVSLYNGFQKDPNSDDWYYYKNGAVDTSKTDVMEGTVNGSSGWWNVVKGKVTRSETVAENSNGWWYINSNGKVDFSYNGFAKNNYGWWYIEGGKVNFSKNSVFDDTKKKIDGTGGWWYVLGGQVQTNFTGLADYSNDYGWWYVNKGKVTFDQETVAQNKYGWWYVKDSKVNFNYKGFAKNNYGWWYIEGGKVNFSKNSVIDDTNKKIDGKGGWYYVVGGQVQTNYTGVANYSNEYGWWYIKNGKVDFSVNSVEENNYGWWAVRNGKVDFSANTVTENRYGWWYVLGGKVQFGYTGVADYANADGWWYINKGQVDFSATTIASNKYGTWYVKNGKVDFSFSGTVTINGQQYNVKNGQVGVTVSSTMNSKAQAQSSSTRWLIVVDTSACRLGVFSGSKGNWVAQYYWLCSPGKPSTPTKKGTFTVQSKGKSFGSSTYTCWYYTQFYGNYLMHSVLYKPGSMTQLSDGRLGQQLSHGCVRLALENAKWIYDNIPKGSTVYVY